MWTFEDRTVYWFMHEESEIRGFIPEEFERSMPAHIREVFDANVEIKCVEDGTVEFVIARGEAYTRLEHLIRNYFRNKSRSDNRRSAAHFGSPGMYEQADIDALYEAQEGRCYYSGQELSKSPKNYSVDHIKPVVADGSSWPGNLALVLTDLNREKKDKSRAFITKRVKARLGEQWYLEHKEFCKRVDKARRKIHKARQAAVAQRMKVLEDELNELFPGAEVEYRLDGDDVVFWVDDVQIGLPAGILRKKRRAFSLSYLASIAESVLLHGGRKPVRSFTVLKRLTDKGSFPS